MDDLAYQMCDPLEYMNGLRDDMFCGGFYFLVWIILCVLVGFSFIERDSR